MSHSVSKPVEFLSPDEFCVERVFPIRNLVGDQYLYDEKSESNRTNDKFGSSKYTSASSKQRHQSTESPNINPTKISRFPNDTNYLPPPYPSIPPKDVIRPLSLPSRLDVEDGAPRPLTERSQLVPNSTGPAGDPPGVLIHDGQPAFYRCEDEPIHTPGAIQQFGALVAMRYDEEGNLQVRYASENTIKFLDYSPEQLFRLKSFFDIMENNVREDVAARVAHALKSIDDQTEDTNLDVFTVSILSPSGSQIWLWCALHIAQGSRDIVICEFEEQSDIFYLDGLHGGSLPTSPTQTIDHDIGDEERAKSTRSGSEPLRVLQIARRRRQKEVSPMDIFNAMTQAQQQLGDTKAIQEIFDTVVGLISELTGFHRVMFYRFDTNKNGCVDAELVNPKASRDIFRGLHYPASDIPQQARDLYKINRIRALHDRDAETARLVCREIADFEKKLDLTHSYLRAMSPIHLKYLTNMGVRSTMSVSIVIDDDLWGLIACHGYGEEGIRVTPPIRELCRNIGECASTNIQRLLMLQRIQARKPPPTAPSVQPPSGFIAASSADLLRVFSADFGLLSIQDEARAIGRLDPYREALAILAHLQSRRLMTVFASQNIKNDFPDLKYPPGINAIAGLLVIPLSMGGNDFLVFFRKGQLNEVRWAGNPYEKVAKSGRHFLEPRSSFKRWTEVVVGVSREWSEDQLDTASILSLLYGRFIEIWRQKESASQNNRMTRLLIRNSAHEVRTPLNAIVNYLEMALENKIDETTRDILAKAHKASKSLIYVIDDLLNLTKAEAGRISSFKEEFDLGATVSEVIAAFRKEALRKGLDLTVSTHQGIPEMVKGDPARLRQVLSNVTSNAFQHSIAGGIKVDIRPIRILENSSVIAITIQDVGIGMSENQLDDLFQEFEQILDEENPAPTPSTTSTPLDTPTSQDSQQLGIGLAVVARYVRNMNGQIRVRSELGKGTIFGIEVPFEHATMTPSRGREANPLHDPTSGSGEIKIPRSLSSSSISISGDRKQSVSTSSPLSIGRIELPRLPSSVTMSTVSSISPLSLEKISFEENRPKHTTFGPLLPTTTEADYSEIVASMAMESVRNLANHSDSNLTERVSHPQEAQKDSKVVVSIDGVGLEAAIDSSPSNGALENADNSPGADPNKETTVDESKTQPNLSRRLSSISEKSQNQELSSEPLSLISDSQAEITEETLPVRGPTRRVDSITSTVISDLSSTNSARPNRPKSNIWPIDRIKEATQNSPLTIPIPSTPDYESSEYSTPMNGGSQSTFPFPKMDAPSTPGSQTPGIPPFKILIAEDNPINARLLTRRLQKIGYVVEISCNGQECHDYFTSNQGAVDVILMDCQMPLVDGDLATRMIRLHEQEVEKTSGVRRRVPIIAVSASLTEDNRFNYIQTGFDGWILKPIDVARLDFLIQGIKKQELRREALYIPGVEWERGGWFLA